MSKKVRDKQFLDFAIVETKGLISTLEADKIDLEETIKHYKNMVFNFEEELRNLGFCKHAYSKIMNQAHPRLCIYCSKPEE